MSRQVIWSPEALMDLSEIREYIARDSETYAAAVVERLLLQVDGLRDFPERGQQLPELRDPSVRHVVSGNYRIIYRLAGTRIDIAAFIHGARDLPRMMLERGV